MEVGYIFTEYFYEYFSIYIHINNVITHTVLSVLAILDNVLPHLVKYLIGYCNFYNQLGYGLVLYIYFYRRYKAKKTNNWKSFYGNSTINWILLNLSILNKFLFNRNFVILISSIISKTYLILTFWYGTFFANSTIAKKISMTINMFKRNYLLSVWTPLFKRTSYISFVSFLKRFSKRK